MSISKETLMEAREEAETGNDQYSRGFVSAVITELLEARKAIEAAKPKEQPVECSEAYREWIKGKNNIDKGPWDAWQAAWNSRPLQESAQMVRLPANAMMWLESVLLSSYQLGMFPTEDDRDKASLVAKSILAHFERPTMRESGDDDTIEQWERNLKACDLDVLLKAAMEGA